MPFIVPPGLCDPFRNIQPPLQNVIPPVDSTKGLYFTLDIGNLIRLFEWEGGGAKFFRGGDISQGGVIYFRGG